jgi:hypothetical protein
LREGCLRGAVLILILVLAALAWLTGHPDAPVVDRAAGWPVVGPWAARFRELYRLPPPPTAPLHDPGPTIEVVTIWLPAEEPPVPVGGATAPVGGAAAPVRARPAGETGGPPLGREPEPVRPLPARSPDAARRERVRALLGAGAREAALGPYALLYDASLAELPWARWSELAAALDQAFTVRTGCAPLGEPAEAVVLFARRQDYRAFQSELERIAALDTAGHASGGLAALWTEGRSADQVESTLVHELAHFVVRRAIGPALPPWLDEGLAEDLAQTPFAMETRRFELGALRADFERRGLRLEVRGALAGLSRVAAATAAGSRLTLRELVALDWDGFVAGDAPLRYAESLFFLRWLFDGGDPAASAALRGFLGEIASGGAADGARLLERLGDAEELEAAFGAWLGAERARRFAAAGLPPL